MEVKGKTVDDNARCVHYHSVFDIIAIKFKCCSEYYPCFYCHAEDTNHLMQVWKKEEFDTKAILCGICNYEMTINEYLNSGYHCPNCSAAFNPKCSGHNHLYFEQ